MPIARPVCSTISVIEGRASRGFSLPEGGKEAAQKDADLLAAGVVPSVRAIRREIHAGTPRAQQVRDYLSVVAEGSPQENQS